MAQIEARASKGLTEEQIAHSLGISQDTLVKNKRIYAEISDRIKKGKASLVALVANKLVDDALAGNTTAQIFVLKCKGGWRDTQYLDIKTDADEKLAAVQQVREETLKLIRALEPAERELYLDLLRKAKARLRVGQTPVEAEVLAREPLPPEVAMLEVRGDVGANGAETGNGLYDDPSEEPET